MLNAHRRVFAGGGAVMTSGRRPSLRFGKWQKQPFEKSCDITREDPLNPSTSSAGKRNINVLRRCADRARPVDGPILRGDLDWSTMRPWKEPRARYGTPSELAADIGRYCAARAGRGPARDHGLPSAEICSAASRRSARLPVWRSCWSRFAVMQAAPVAPYYEGTRPGQSHHRFHDSHVQGSHPARLAAIPLPSAKFWIKRPPTSMRLARIPSFNTT